MTNNRLLIIEDNEIDYFVASRLIKKWRPEYDIHWTKNGKEGIAFLKNNPDSFPCCILINLFMPFGDGIEFLKEYEREFAQKFPKTKLMVLTASLDPKKKKQVMGFSSVVAFLEKPIGRNEFENCL